MAHLAGALGPPPSPSHNPRHEPLTINNRFINEVIDYTRTFEACGKSTLTKPKTWYRRVLMDFAHLHLEFSEIRGPVIRHYNYPSLSIDNPWVSID